MLLFRFSGDRPTGPGLGWGALWLAVIFTVGCTEVPLDPVPSYPPEQEALFALTPDAARLNYVILGDWGRRGGSYQQDVAVQMGLMAQTLPGHFVITTGDNFYERGVSGVADSHWRASFERIYTHTSLMVPWYVTLGNHDHKGNVQAQIDYSGRSPRWRLPSAYYSIVQAIDEETSVEFVFLDTEPLREPGEAAHQQRRWVDSTLAVSVATWHIVVGHHPIYSGGEHGDEEGLIKDLLPILEKHQVDAYFSGHDHDLQHLHDGAIHYFVSGAASKVRTTGQHRYTRFGITRPGFMAVSMTSAEMVVQFIDHQGNRLYGVKIGARKATPAGSDKRLETMEAR